MRSRNLRTQLLKAGNSRVPGVTPCETRLKTGESANPLTDPHGRGCGVGRALDCGVPLGVGVGRGVEVGVGEGDGGGVVVGVAVAVAVAVGVGVGEGEVPPTAAKTSTRPQP
jgi:hypothetical protein